MVQKIPLFPLHSVLYPGIQITLHIFEDRYREMISRCLEQSCPFGIVLIRSGSDVDPDDPFIKGLRERAGGIDSDQSSAPTVPFQIGTLARIHDAHRFDDGRFYLNAVGVRRFRIQYMIQHEPYGIASVAHITDHAVDGVAEQSTELHDVLKQYWTVMARVTGRKQQPDIPPEDPTELSYWLASRLQVDLLRKQRWLEADVLQRLRELTIALRSELALLPDSTAPGRGGTWSWN